MCATGVHHEDKILMLTRSEPNLLSGPAELDEVEDDPRGVSSKTEGGVPVLLSQENRFSILGLNGRENRCCQGGGLGKHD